MPIPPLKPNNRQQSWRSSPTPRYVQRPNGGRPARNGSFWPLSPLWKKRLIIAASACFVVGTIGTASLLAWISRGLPDPNQLIIREVAQSTKIYDRTGEQVLYEIHGDEQRTLVTLDAIPDHLEWATVAIEDKGFYQHQGFSFWAIFRTAVTNVLFNRKAGASTLTQQFIKNAVLTNEKSYIRKLKEVLLAYKVEKRFSKQEILQMYLNEIPYGSTAYGVEAASRRYFGKTVKDITLAEAAVLAALPQSPSRYSPYSGNRDFLIGRQHYILDQMAQQGYITHDQAQIAKGEILDFQTPTANIQAPHFVMYVKEYLSEKYGEKLVEQGGLRIVTTLDLYKQKIAEEVVAELTVKNVEKWDANNAALVSLDPKTGEILALVGSRDYFDDEIDGQVNIVTSKRQPGSSIKPLVYAALFLKGYPPTTVLYDVITNFSTDPSKPYEPKNYDGGEHGPVTVRAALAGSLNIPAVKTIYLAGVDNVLTLAGDLGYSTLKDKDRFGLALVLGGGEVKLLEHANAFSAFAREGFINRPASILRVEDRNGTVLEEFKPQERKVLDPKVARTINDILSDNAARAYVFGERNWLTLPGRSVAAKTGTTNDYRDAWTIGYTPSLVTGVWVGNNDNHEMKRGADGSKIAAPIWNEYMKRVLGDTPSEDFRKPEYAPTGKPILDGDIAGGASVKVDKVSGLLATENTPPELVEERVYRDPHTILYYINKNDPLGDTPAEPQSDPQFELWESRVRAWAAKTAGSSTLATGEPPTETDNVHLPENRPTITLLSPGNNELISSPLLIARVETQAARGIASVEYLIDDLPIATVGSFPYSLEQRVDFLENGFHRLTAKACDDVRNCASVETEFNLALAQAHQSAGNIAFTMTSPKTGLSATAVDFPLSLRFETNHPEEIAKINISYTPESGGAPVFVTTITGIKASLVIGEWAKVPPSGTYKLSAEAVTWSKRSIALEPVTITVANSGGATNVSQ